MTLKHLNIDHTVFPTPASPTKTTLKDLRSEIPEFIEEKGGKRFGVERSQFQAGAGANCVPVTSRRRFSVSCMLQERMLYSSSVINPASLSCCSLTGSSCMEPIDSE
jgi:hypothetical protein